MTIRKIQQLIQGMPASDGAGVKLIRSLGSANHLRVDPFLMLDAFSSENPDDYVAGFPAHPHRGFETVTYLLDGHMLHEDHLGNKGNLKSGAVQWMTAGRGIIHSEMPQQTEGRMRGFQLWINLPAQEKMKPAAYRDIPAASIPLADWPGGGRIKVIAGTLQTPAGALAGPIQGLSTAPVYLDIALDANGVFEHALPSGHNAFVYVYEGDVQIGAESPRALPQRSAGILSAGNAVRIAAAGEGARLILLAARPLNEPVAQYGPFVMNTAAELEQAVRDYQTGRLTTT